MDFKEAYSRLNTEQKIAVDTLEGPLLVLAGPGTGKTQLLSARVANILTKTDSKPENILCLTFTEKAANNMKSRLLDMIGPAARKVMIKTFHGLGAEIMNSNPDCFWNAAKLEPAPEAIKLEIITDIINKLPLNNPLSLKFSGQYTLVGDILGSINKAKEAGLTPEKLEAITKINIAYLKSIEEIFRPLVGARISKNQISEYRTLANSIDSETHDAATVPIPSIGRVIKESLLDAIEEAEITGKPTALSEWKRQWFETISSKKVFKDIRKNTWWLELAGVYKKYQHEMHKNRYFDFADMILEVITQLEKNETLRTELQERFNFILIDEFQDTNDAQFRLSHLIASNPINEGKPNIMAVGDDDQAIYRFQGANLSNARQFMESYKDTKLVVLTKNYRSHQDILDAAEEVAGQIEHRLINEFESLDKHIVSSRDIESGLVEHWQFPSQTEQYTQLAHKILNDRKISLKSTAILARKHGSLELMAAQLNALQIPIRYERSSNILEHPVVLVITQLAQLLEQIYRGNQEHVNSLLADILPHPAWEIPAKTLWQLALHQSKNNADWIDMLLNHSDPHLNALAEWFLELSKAARHYPLKVCIEHLLGLRELNGFISPIKSYYTKNKLSSDYIFSLTALERLRSLAADYAKSDQAGLRQFVAYLKINQEHHVVLSNEAAVITGEQPVELMTVHKAKGLEFEDVYVIDAIERHWQPSHKRRATPSNLESLQSYGEDNDDYARLLFVALTRAERNLIVSSFLFNEHGQEVLPSAFIHHLKVRSLPPSENTVAIAETTLKWPQLKNEQKKELLKSSLENYQLSATGLIDFLDVTQGGPEHFINRHILKLPEVRSANLSFGSAIHTALETAQRLVNGGELIFDVVLQSFNEALENEYIDKSEFKRYSEHGKELLETLILKNHLVLKPGDFPERKISDVPLAGTFIKGVLDLIQVSPRSVTIIDYKTGKPLSSLTTTSQAEGIRAWKHRLQLTYYALLAKESGILKPGQELHTAMMYVEAEDVNKMTLAFKPSTEEIKRLKKLISAVVTFLNSGEFPDITKYTSDLAGIQEFEADLLKNTRIA